MGVAVIRWLLILTGVCASVIASGTLAQLLLRGAGSLAQRLIPWWRIRVLRDLIRAEQMGSWKPIGVELPVWTVRVARWYNRRTRMLLRAGLSTHPLLVLGMIAGTLAVTFGVGAWSYSYFSDVWISLLVVVVLSLLPSGLLELAASYRRDRLEGQIGAAAANLAIDIANGHNPQQALRRLLDKLPEPARSLLAPVYERMASGRQRDAQLLEDLGRVWREELDSSRAVLMLQILRDSWDDPKTASALLLRFGTTTAKASTLRRGAESQSASYRLYIWSMLTGCLIAYVLIPWRIPTAKGFLTSLEGIASVRMWLGSILLALGLGRMLIKLPG